MPEGGRDVASVKCEHCNCGIGAGAHEENAFIMQETNGLQHHFCSAVCCDLWCNEQIKEGVQVERISPSGMGEWRVENPDNGTIRYRREEVEAWLESREHVD
jgi:hypothetical protein